MEMECPQCGKIYQTELDRPKNDNRSIQAIFPHEPRWKREQLISGICSDRCWDLFTGAYCVECKKLAACRYFNTESVCLNCYIKNGGSSEYWWKAHKSL